MSKSDRAAVSALRRQPKTKSTPIFPEDGWSKSVATGTTITGRISSPPEQWPAPMEDWSRTNYGGFPRDPASTHRWCWSRTFQVCRSCSLVRLYCAPVRTVCRGPLVCGPRPKKLKDLTPIQRVAIRLDQLKAKKRADDAQQQPSIEDSARAALKKMRDPKATTFADRARRWAQRYPLKGVGAVSFLDTPALRYRGHLADIIIRSFGSMDPSARRNMATTLGWVDNNALEQFAHTVKGKERL